MKAQVIAVLLLAVIVLQLDYLDVFKNLKITVMNLKHSTGFLHLLFIILGLCLLALGWLKYNMIQEKKRIFLCNLTQKKSKSEFEIERQRETIKQVEKLVNSSAYKKHREQYQTYEDFDQNKPLTEEELILPDNQQEQDGKND